MYICTTKSDNVYNGNIGLQLFTLFKYEDIYDTSIPNSEGNLSRLDFRKPPLPFDDNKDSSLWFLVLKVICPSLKWRFALQRV